MSKLSCEELEEGRKKKRLYMRKYRAGMSDEHKAARLQQSRQYSAKCRALRSEEKRAACRQQSSSDGPMIKRKRYVLDLEKRVNVIREYEKNPRVERLARKFGCSQDQIRAIIFRKEEILRLQSECPKNVENKRTKKCPLDREKRIHVYLDDIASTPNYMEIAKKLNCSQNQIKTIILKEKEAPILQSEEPKSHSVEAVNTHAIQSKDPESVVEAVKRNPIQSEEPESDIEIVEVITDYVDLDDFEETSKYMEKKKFDCSQEKIKPIISKEKEISSLQLHDPESDIVEAVIRHPIQPENPESDIDEIVEVITDYVDLDDVEENPNYMGIKKKFDCSQEGIKPIILKENEISSLQPEVPKSNIVAAINKHRVKSDVSKYCLNIAEMPDIAQCVELIREYIRNPSLREIQDKFNCTVSQLKSIIANADSILTRHSTRTDKINFLNKVIYEYVQRAAYHDIKFNMNTLQGKALQVRDAISLPDFFPNSLWLLNFKTAYKMPNINATTVRKTIELNKPKMSSLNISDLIIFVKQSEYEEGDIKATSKNKHDDTEDLQKKSSEHQEKLDFLNKVVYEYVERAAYHDILIKSETVQKKASQVREAIALCNFFPNSLWLTNFMVAYGIPNFNAYHMRKGILFKEPKLSSLKCIDLIKYVSSRTRMEMEKQQESTGKQYPTRLRQQKKFEILKNLPKVIRKNRRNKIKFLGKVIFEFVERMVYHNIRINTTTVQKKALKLQKALDVSNFIPNRFWLQDFKTTYRISDFDLASLREKISFKQPKKTSFKCNDLIQHVIDVEKAQYEQQHQRVERGADLKKDIETSAQAQNDFENAEKHNLDTSRLQSEKGVDDTQNSDMELNDPGGEVTSLDAKLTATNQNPSTISSAIKVSGVDTTVLKYEIGDTQYSSMELNDPGREVISLDEKLTASNENPSTISSFSKVSAADTSILKYEIDDLDSDIELNECSTEFISLDANEKQPTSNQNPTTISGTTLVPPVDTSLVKHETNVHDTEYLDIELNDPSSEFIYLNANKKLPATNRNPPLISSVTTMKSVDTSILKHNTAIGGTQYCGIELNNPSALVIGLAANDKLTDSYENPNIISSTTPISPADTSILKFEAEIDNIQHSVMELNRQYEDVIGSNENPTEFPSGTPVSSVDTSILKFEKDIVGTQHSDIELNGPGKQVACLDKYEKLADSNENPTAMVPSATQLPHIENSQDAMLFLKALEDFFMQRDNVRAILLLTQVEEDLKQGD